MIDKQFYEVYEQIKYSTGCYDDDARSCAEILIDDLGYRKTEWIGVKDKLPKKFANVLCFYPSKRYGAHVVVDYMESDRGYFAEQFRYGEPTHWMPLPELPIENF